MPNLQTQHDSLGRLLRALRQKVGVGLKSAAPAVNVTHGYLSKIENDKKIPSRGLILRLCEFYKCDKNKKEKALSLSDELLASSGSLPNDIKEIVQTHGDDVFKLIRSTYSNSEDGEGNNNDNKP